MNLSISHEKRFFTSLIDCLRCPVIAGNVSFDDSSYSASANLSNWSLLGPPLRVELPILCQVCVQVRQCILYWLGCMCRREERVRERSQLYLKHVAFIFSLVKFTFCHWMDLRNIDVASKWHSLIFPGNYLLLVIKLCLNWSQFISLGLSTPIM